MSSIAEAKNMCTRPYIDTRTTYGWNVIGSQRADGRWQYIVKDTTNFVRATVCGTMNTTATAVGDVLVIVYECERNPELLVGLAAGGSYCMRSCEWIMGGVVSDTVGWNACRITDTSIPNHEFCIHIDCGQVCLLGCANYTADDWPTIKEQIDVGNLPTAWFAPPKDAHSGPPVLIP